MQTILGYAIVIIALIAFATPIIATILMVWYNRRKN